MAKFYVRDAGYQKIDLVKEFTFNQDIKFTKGTILQQLNAQGIVQAYGTIVDVPTGTLDNPGLGTKYKVGKIYGNFDNDTTDLYQNAIGEENVIKDVVFEQARTQEQWVTGKAYTVDTQVYNAGKIYKATNKQVQPNDFYEEYWQREEV